MIWIVKIKKENSQVGISLWKNQETKFHAAINLKIIL